MNTINDMTDLTIGLGLITLTIGNLMIKDVDTSKPMPIELTLVDIIAMTGALSCAVHHLEQPNMKGDKHYQDAFEMTAHFTTLLGRILSRYFEKEVLETAKEIQAESVVH